MKRLSFNIKKRNFSNLLEDVGSAPRIERIFPKNSKYSKKELILKSLPFGIQPGEFILDSIDWMKMVAYVFHIPAEKGRNVISSLGFTITNQVNVEDFKKIIIELITFLKHQDLLTISCIKENLKEIYSSLNKSSEIKIFNPKNRKSFIFDLPASLHKNDLKISKNTRKIRGGFL